MVSHWFAAKKAFFPSFGLLIVVGVCGLFLHPSDLPVRWTLALALGGAGLAIGFPATGRPWILLGLGWVGLVGGFGWATGLFVIGLGTGGAWILSRNSLPPPLKGILWMSGLALLAGARWSQPFSPILHLGVPLLASAFMFRGWLLIRQGQNDSFVTTLSYFFVFPNAVFLLFPVIDFRRFQKGLGTALSPTVFHRGVHSITRGLIHLLWYRVLYLYGVPESIDTPTHALRFLFLCFPLYLQVSGQFHLIVGALEVCGLNLPRTHHNFFLARGFVDFWKRINIYWKEFATHQIYFPALRRLKPLGIGGAGLGASLLVFVATWALHSYQWFWFTGRWLFSLQDALFWGILGMLTCGEWIWRYRRPPSTSPPSVIRDGGAILGTWLCIAGLWSLWSAESLIQWRQGIALAFSSWTGWDWGIALGLAGLGAFTLGWLARWWEKRSPVLAPSLITLVVFSVGAVVSGENSWFAIHRSGKLNAADQTQLVRGYYGALQDRERFHSRLSQVYRARPQDWNRKAFVDAQGQVLPNFRGHYKGAILETNQWGMVDRDHALTRPDNSVRVAFLGASHVMGSGVSYGDRFTTLLENQWSLSSRRLEILNFAVGGMTWDQQKERLIQVVAPFRPTHVVLVATPFAPQLLADRVGPGMGLQTLDELRRSVEALGAKAILVYQPTLDRPTDEVPVDEWARRSGWQVVSLTHLYRGTDWSRLGIAPWDHHPNAEGHQRIARALAPLLFPLLRGKGVTWNR